MARGPGTDAIAQSTTTTASAPADPNATANPTQLLQRAVVVEVLYDLAAYPEEDMEEMKALVDSPNELLLAPRNSLIARVITGGADKSAPEANEQPTEEETAQADVDGEATTDGEKIGEVGTLCYPFFPPHLCFPVKPGETVWLITDSADVPSKIMYWLCRVPEPDHIDDINYTIADRKFVGSLAPATSKEKADAAQANEEVAGDEPQEDPQDEEGVFTPPEENFDRDGDGRDDRIFGFPNGTGKEEGFTLKGEFAYEDIVKVAQGYNQFLPQHVPRFTKRPGDFVIQGSNNTLICLGEERGWTKDKDADQSEFSNATFDEATVNRRMEGSWGTIDIVAGRGRYDWSFTGAPEDVEPFLTAPRCVMNTPVGREMREPWVEINKNPQESESAEVNRLDNPPEGDPDFWLDAARLWVAQGSDLDGLFNIASPGDTIPSPIGEEVGQMDIISGEFPSCVVAKADEIRLIARKFEEDDPIGGSPEINGSIRIIKEGKANEDLAAIFLLPDGTIQISGSTIFLGRSPDDEGVGTGPGDSESQPYVRYKQLEDLLTTTMNNIQAFCDTLLGHVTPGYGAPSPQINNAAAVLKSDMDSRKGEIPSLKSERIFGE